MAVSRVYDIAAISDDPHYRARGMLTEWTDPVAGRVKGAGIAPRFSETPGKVWRGAPWLGQDNEAILAGLLGYSTGTDRPPARDRDRRRVAPAHDLDERGSPRAGDRAPR